MIFRGDDAGSTHSANRALVQAAHAGVLRNISVMTPGPAFDSWAPAFRELKGVAFGLHATLNAEWSGIKWGPELSRNRVPSLVDDRGYFLPSPVHLSRRGFSVDEALAEVQAQLDDARDQGLPISYLDEHLEVGRLDGLREGFARLAEREGLVYRPDLPSLPPAETSDDPIRELLRRVDLAGEGCYLHAACPTFDCAEMRLCFSDAAPLGQVGRERDRMRRLLTNSALRECLDARGVRSITYGDLGF